MSDVGERTAVDECRCAFRGLHEVRVHRIQKQGNDSACDSHVLNCKRLVVKCIAEENVLDSASEVVNVPGQAEDGHYF